MYVIILMCIYMQCSYPTVVTHWSARVRKPGQFPEVPIPILGIGTIDKEVGFPIKNDDFP